MTIEIVQIPMLKDNYAYLLLARASPQESASKRPDEVTVIIDPAEPQPAIDQIERHGGRLDFILNTHHHFDHTGGNEVLKKRYGARVLAGILDKGRIKTMDEGLVDGQRVMLGGQACQVIATPAHTKGHVAYWFAAGDALFCGDTLFSLGCGALFEGSPADMWSSLCKLRALPDTTKVYCAHEYTDYFVGFARSLDPHNVELQSKQAWVRSQRSRGEPTIPSLLGEEKRLNPFMRADDANFTATAGLKTGSPADAFAKLVVLEEKF